MKEFVFLAVVIILSTLFAVAMILAGFICQYKKECAVKKSTYECGVKTILDAKIPFDVKYINYAIMFLIFDIETIFLYPFAIFVNALGLFAIIEAFLFIGILLFGLVYAINKKMLRWV